MAAKDQNLKQVLERFDDVAKPLDDRDIYNAISNCLKINREAGQAPSLEEIAEWSAFMFCPEYHWKEGGWESYYGPMGGGVSEEGKQVHTPDIHQFDSTTFEYWAKRAHESKHPVLKVRYADLCWEFQKKISGVAPHIDLAHIVIDSTIDAASKNLVKHEVNSKKKLARALSVALAIGDIKRVETLRDTIVAYEDAVARDDAAGLWGFSYDLIVENKKISKSPVLETKIITDLESRLSRLIALHEGKPIDPWGAERAALRLASYYRRKKKQDDVRRVMLAYGTAFECLAEGASGMQATGWMRTVYNHYRDFGLQHEADGLLLKIRESAKRSHDEMAKLSQKMEIPKEKMDAFVDYITQGTLSESLNRIAVRFITGKQQVIDQLKKFRESAPLMSMISMSIVDNEGRPTAQIGGVDDDLEGHVIYHISKNMQAMYMFLFLTIDRIREKFQPSVDDIINHLRQSPVFPEDGFVILRQGLELYFNNDHLAAAHVLIPQIEASIRHLLHLCGGNLWKPHRSGSLMLKNLEDVLREKSIAKVLSEDGVLNLRVLLTDQRGWNIRNGVCHGLLPPDSFSRGMTDRLLHVLLFLALIHMHQKEESPD